jgi:uncharacterized protein (DUF1778 family)
MMTMNTPTSITEPEVEESKGTISFSVRLTKKERDLLARAAEKRGWSLTSLLKSAALEKAVHILNTSAPNRIDFRRTAEEIARQVFTRPSGYTYDDTGATVPAQVYERLEEANQDLAPNPFEVSPWPPPPEFLANVRDAARYGGTEFLDLILQAAEAITTRNKPDLPDPIDPNSI